MFCDVMLKAKLRDVTSITTIVLKSNLVTFLSYLGFVETGEKCGGSPRGRVGKVPVFQLSQSFDHLTAVSGVGSSPALATCETSQVLLAGVSGGFPGVFLFRPTYPLARLYE